MQVSPQYPGQMNSAYTGDLPPPPAYDEVVANNYATQYSSPLGTSFGINQTTGEEAGNVAVPPPTVPAAGGRVGAGILHFAQFVNGFLPASFSAVAAGANPETAIKDYRIEAILCCVVCFPLGIPALWYSQKVRKSVGEGDFDAARRYSLRAKLLSTGGILICTMLIFWKMATGGLFSETWNEDGDSEEHEFVNWTEEIRDEIYD